MNISFDELRRFAEFRWPEPIETSLLGDVFCKWDAASGQWTGVIHEWIEVASRKHGMEVLVADYKRGTYSFRLIAPPNAKVSGAGTASAGLPGWQANGETE